jgi:DNA polymerase-3 subunit alpha
LPESPFIHLAIRSSYSLLESMISPKDVKAWCEEHLVPAVAITDRNNLFGALEISLTLCGAGIQPIMACCFDVVEDVPRAEPSRLSLYAQNETGYRRLMYLSSRAYLDAADGVPKLSRALVMEQTEGLIVPDRRRRGGCGETPSQRPGDRCTDGTVHAGGRLSGTVLCRDHAPRHTGRTRR